MPLAYRARGNRLHFPWFIRLRFSWTLLLFVLVLHGLALGSVYSHSLDQQDRMFATIFVLLSLLGSLYFYAVRMWRCCKCLWRLGADGFLSYQDAQGEWQVLALLDDSVCWAGVLILHCRSAVHPHRSSWMLWCFDMLNQPDRYVIYLWLKWCHRDS
jgi:hypothetical protein